MKKYIISLVIGMALAFTACENYDIETPDFDVSIDPLAILTMDGDVYVCNKDNVLFLFSGNPDIISFYSGEPGQEYRYRNRTQLEGIPKMFFTKTGSLGTSGAYAQYNVYDSMRVMVSSTYPGMTRDLSLKWGANKAVDVRDSIKDANNILKPDTWTDITDRFNVSFSRDGSNTVSKKSSVVDLSEFKDKPFVLAFLYKVSPDIPQNGTMHIRNLRIYNETPEMTDTIVTTATAAWSAFNFYTPDPYAINDYSGTEANQYHRTWVLEGATNEYIRIRGNSSTSYPKPGGGYYGFGDNDWAISFPIDLQAYTPDKPQPVKGLAEGRMTTYPYMYEQAGEYTVTFVASNSQYADLKTVIKEIKIRVVD